MRAALYARVSADDRANDGRNLRGQLDMGREYARQRGYEIVAELAEDSRGASGAEIDLPELNRIRSMAAAGEFDALVVREIDRLSRNLAKQLIVEEELQRAGVQIEYVIGEYPDTPEGRLNKHIKASIAEYEREKIAERTRRARRRKVQDGHVMVHGHPPYGYREAEIDGKRTLVVHEQEARVVSLIFQWYVAGDEESGPLSTYGVTRRLTRAGIPTRADNDPGMKKQRGRGQWNTTSVAKILHREAYAGTWHYGKVRNNDSKKGKNPRNTWIAVKVPAILPREIWEAAQERMKYNKRNATRNTKYQYLLRRRAECANCDSKMSAVGMKKSNGRYRYHYYHCQASTGLYNYARECDNRLHFRADDVDAAVWGWVRKLLLHPKATLKGMREEQTSREEALEPLRHRLAVIDDLIIENQRKLERALDAYLEDALVKEMLAERAEQCRNLIAELEQQRAELKAEIAAQTVTDEQIQTVAEFIADMADGFEASERDFNRRRRLIEQLDLTARLTIEDGQKVAYIKCLAGKGRSRIVNTSSSSGCHTTA